MCVHQGFLFSFLLFETGSHNVDWSQTCNPPVATFCMTGLQA
jgi:hypothetical protein